MRERKLAETKEEERTTKDTTFLWTTGVNNTLTMKEEAITMSREIHILQEAEEEIRIALKRRVRGWG